MLRVLLCAESVAVCQECCCVPRVLLCAESVAVCCVAVC